MIKSTFKAIAENKYIKNKLNELVDDPKAALRFLIMANAAKDAINCGFYVNQSLNNKQIPEDKRKFVAALDMANGVLMIATQLFLGFKFTSKEVQDKICKNLFGNVEKKASDFVKGRILSHPNDFIADLRIRLANSVKDIPQGCKKGFTAISTIVITTVVAKRIIVPFIATPVASWFKNKYMDKKPAKPAETTQLPVKTINPQNMQSPLNQTIKPNTRLSSLDNFNNFVYKGTFN